MALRALLILCVLFCSRAYASDEDPLQDFCVRDTDKTSWGSNGFPCKLASEVIAADFRSSILSSSGNTSNVLRSKVTAATVGAFPGLNTLGVAMARLDLAVGGLNPPHFHPRATELLYLVQGVVYVGFVSSDEQKLYAQVISAGDLFVFPRGLVHFQLNVGKEPAFGIGGFNSQNPGTSQVAKGLFASSPEVEDAVLLEAFQMPSFVLPRIRELIGST